MNSTAKLGAFMLVALIIIGFFIIRIEQISLSAKGERQQVRATFTSVAGLDAKSAVRIAGVRVGLVDRIELQGDRALVTIALNPDVKLHEGARAMVRAMGILGEQYVELDPGPLDNPPLRTDAILVGETPAGMEKLFDTANDVAVDVKAVTENLRKTLGGVEGEERLRDILDNIRELTEQLKTVAAENRETIAATLVNFRDFSASLAKEMPVLAGKINQLADRVDSMIADNRGNLDETMVNVKDLTAELRRSANNITDITGKISRGEGSVGKLINDSTTVDNLNATLKSVESGVDSLKDTLGRPQRWQLFVDMRAERLPGVDDSRAGFSADLHTTSERFYRVGLVRSPFGPERTSNERITVIDPDGTARTTIEERVKSTNGYSFNAQVGYRIGATTFRAGLFESEGGIGVDHQFWRDKAGVTLEAYNFNRETKAPHLRFEGRYFVTPNIYAFGGMDDPTWKERRSAIVGAGIRWNDEDLKYLLGSASSLAGR